MDPTALLPTRPVVVALDGELDLATAPAAAELLGERVRRAGPDVDVDLAAVTFLDCAGVSALLGAGREARARGGRVRLRHVPPQARRVLDLLGTRSALPLV